MIDNAVPGDEEPVVDPETQDPEEADKNESEEVEENGMGPMELLE